MSALSRPSKYLRYDEDHFQGYWVQLTTLIRINEDADELLDGLLLSPLLALLKAINSTPPNPAMVAIAAAIKTLYVAGNYGDPPGSFPPTEEQMLLDPLKIFKEFAKATQLGRHGGHTPGGAQSVPARRWVRSIWNDYKRHRSACKFIWETAVATLSSSQATSIIAGLPYGAGPKLLAQIEGQQRRQTSMALYTLFSQLITIQLASGEKLTQLFGRILEIRNRLKNWRPPIVLPDKLIIVCLLRLLPRKFHASRTIIMTNASMTLETTKEVLLDVENKDAERITADVGSSGTPRATTTPTPTALLGQRQPQRQPRGDGTKSEKYHSEGPCSFHGTKCAHASSECYNLHPEIAPPEVRERILKQNKRKKNKKKLANLASSAAEDAAKTPDAAATIATTAEDDMAFGFMNEDYGYAMMMTTSDELDEESKAEDDMFDDGKLYLDNNAIAITFHAAPSCCYNFITTAALKLIGEVATQNDKPWEGQGLTELYTEWLGCEEDFPVMDLPMQYTAKAKAVPREKWERRGFFYMYNIDIDLSEIKMTVVPSERAVVILGHEKCQILRKVSDKHEDALMIADGIELIESEEFEAKSTPEAAANQQLECSNCHCHDHESHSWNNCHEVKEVNSLALMATQETAIDLSDETEATSQVTESEGANKADSALVESAVENLTLLLKETRKTVDSEAKKKRRKFKGHGWSKKRKKKANKTKSEKIEGAAVTTVAAKPKAKSKSRVKGKQHKPVFISKRQGQQRRLDAISRLGRRGGVQEMTPEWYDVLQTIRHAETRSLQVPTLLTFDPDQRMMRVRSIREYDAGFTTTLHYDRLCPAAAVSEAEMLMPEAPVAVPEQQPQSSNPEYNGMRMQDVDADEGLHLPKFLARPVPTLTIDLIDKSPQVCNPFGSPITSLTPGTRLLLEIKSSSEYGGAFVVGKPEACTILDSGASEHLTPAVQGNLCKSSIRAIHGLSGKATTVTGMGKINKVENVMCCPETTRKLLSVGKLLDQVDGKVVFTKTHAYLVNGKKSMAIAKRNASGLYHVIHPHFKLNAGSEATASAMVGNSVSTDVARERITTLHRIFGHPSKETLRNLIKTHNFRGISEGHVKLLQPCDACLLGKAHKANKGRHSEHKAERFGERICADCSGPFRTRSVGGAYYVLVVIDEYSSWTWIVPVSTLTSVHTHLEHIIEVQLHQRDDTTVKFFRSDGGTEFTNQKVSALLAKHSIQRETTCAGSSHQNGKAERRIRTIFEGVRTSLSDSGLSSGYWAEAAVYTTYTLNRIPAHDGKSPFEKRYGKAPKVSHMRPFGNPCVLYRERKVAGKIEDAGIRATFLGYGYVNGKKGSRVKVANTNKVVTSLHVGFGAYPQKAHEVEPLQIGEIANTQHAQLQQQVAPQNNGIANNNRQVGSTNVPAGQSIGTSHVQTGNNAGGTNTNAQNVITTAEIVTNDTISTDAFIPGAQVQGNWRGHGKYYDAVVSAVHKAGSRITYDLVYDEDGEAEKGMSRDRIRGRVADSDDSANIAVCGHALVTDCNPAYLATVPDLVHKHITPKHFGQAMLSKEKIKWLNAVLSELKSLKDQKVYIFCEKLPPGQKALSCLWVFKLKSDADGKVSRYKARLTVNGKRQRFGIDYTETFSPVAFATTIRLLFVIGLAFNCTFHQYDIKCAFLCATLPENERVYMRSPPGDPRKGFWLLVKSLYGLCQAPLRFNQHLHKTLTKLGFKASTFDPCFYYHAGKKAYLAVVVDDMILAAPDKDFAKQFYADMDKVYDIKDMGTVNYVVGVRVKVLPESVSLCQDSYITELNRIHSPGSTPTNTPATPALVLCQDGEHNKKPSPLLSNPTVYRSLIGGLMYALITRPDVAASVSICARYLQAPRQVHLDAARRILRYLYVTRNMPLVYPRVSPSELQVTCLVDSSWQNDVDTRRSRYGYAIYVGRALVSWCSKLHATVSMSSAEAEYTAATEAGKHVKWVRSLLQFALPDASMPATKMFEDNAACRTMASCARVSGRNKHFELRHHFIRELVKAGIVTLCEIGTANQVADIFTKPLARPGFEKHRSLLLHGLPRGFAAF